MKNNIYTAIPDWFNKVQSQSTDNTSTTTTQTTIIGGGGSSISMSVHNLFIKSDTTITIDDFTISDLFVTDQITDTENWLTTPLLHTLPNTEVSVTTAAQLLYIGAYDKNNNQIKLYQFSEAISTVVIPENCYYLRASSNKTNTDLTIKYVGLNNFNETQLNKLESSSFQNFLTLVEGDEKGVITNSVLNLSLVFQNPLYYTLDKAGNVLISIDRDALFSQSENPTDDRYVTTVANSVQDILSLKNFKEGLSINGIEIVERNGFLYIKGNLATTGGITAYTDDPDDPGGSGGLPGGGAIGDIVITGSGNALVDASLSEDHSVITFTKGWLVDAESDQSITGIKDFINGLKLSGQLIKIVDGVLFLDCSIAATGGITAYATMPGEGSSSIMDQLVVDTEYFIITEEGVLTIVPGSLGGISNIYVTGNGNALTTVTLSEDGKTVSFTKDKTFADDTEIKRIISEFKNEVNEQLKRFVTLDTEQEITAIKHFIEGVTIGSNKHKFYEKDGVLWLEGDIAITGGITTFARENADVTTIMDGVVVDEETITKGDDNVLRVKDAGVGTSFDENAMWSALASSSDKQINKSHLTTALTGYATETWVSQNYATSSALESVSTKLNNFLEGSDTDTIINKWKELEAFLSGMAETDNLAEILETKADKKYVDSTFVTLATKQTITGEKTFSSLLNTAAIKASGAITAPSLAASDYVTIAGIKLRKLEDGALMLEGNLALTGALTMYASNGQSFDTIYDGLPIDNDTIYWQEVDGSRVLKAREGSGSSFDKSAMWAALEGATTEQINKTHLTTALNGYATESWVTSKNYLTSVSIATISDLHANWDALLKAAPSSYVTRWPTISEVTGKKNLVVKLNGGKTEGKNQFTYNATETKTINITPAGIGAAASSHSHSWSNITSGKPTTLAGYGITDAYTKNDADSRYVNISGDTMSGQLVADGGIYLGYGNAIQSSYTHLLKTGYEDGAGDYFEIGIGGDNGVKMYLRGINNGTLVWNGNTVWNAANSNRSDANWSCYTLNASRINSSEYVNCAKIGYNISDSKDGLPWYGMGYRNNNEMTFSGYGGVNIRTSFGNNVQFASNGLSYFYSHVLIKGSNRLSFDDYGGGWYMSDNEWMRTYNNKGVVCNDLWIDSRVRFGGNAEFGGNNSPNGVVFYDSTRAQRGIFAWYNDHFYMAKFENNKESTGYVAIYEDYVGVGGNLLVSGGATFYSSDIRYKSIMQQVNLSLLDIAKAPSFIYRWNKHGMNQNRLNLGGSAQYTQTILPWAVEDNDNFLSMDYATVAYTFAVHTARHLLDYETKTDKEIRKLKNRIKYLEKQLKSLHYEEANIVDN